MKRLVHPCMAILVLAAGLATARDAAANECVWGKPGYRACVDDLLAKRKSQEGPETAKPAEPRTFKTAPARNRAPALTPLGQADAQPQPTPRMPRGIDSTLDNQRGMDDALARMKRDAARPAIMPDNGELFKLPGRICPSQGC